MVPGLAQWESLGCFITEYSFILMVMCQYYLVPWLYIFYLGFLCQLLGDCGFAIGDNKLLSFFEDRLVRNSYSLEP